MKQCARCAGTGRVNSFPDSERDGVSPAPDSDDSLRDLSADLTSICGSCEGEGGESMLQETGTRAPDASIVERVEAIRDKIGWTNYGDAFDLRLEVMDLCREVALLAHQVSVYQAATEGREEGVGE